MSPLGKAVAVAVVLVICAAYVKGKAREQVAQDALVRAQQATAAAAVIATHAGVATAAMIGNLDLSRLGFPFLRETLKRPAKGAPKGKPTRQPKASRRAVDDIPRRELGYYKAAPKRNCPGLRWTVLAGIGKVESDHGRSRLPGVHSGQNWAGAAGPMQFGNGTGKAGNSWATYGHGGNIYKTRDAIPAAARYLCAHGAQRNVRRGIYGYNHSQDYVNLVLRWAGKYEGGR